MTEQTFLSAPPLPECAGSDPVIWTEHCCLTNGDTHGDIRRLYCPTCKRRTEHDIEYESLCASCKECWRKASRKPIVSSVRRSLTNDERRELAAHWGLMADILRMGFR